MAKALKVTALVVGVAALAVVTGGAAVGLGLSLATTAFGVSAGTLFLAAGALSLGATLLMKAPKIPGSQIDRLTASIDPRAPRKTVLGSTAMATDIRYQEWYGADQQFCTWIVALASHRVTSVDEIWLNDDLAWTAAGGAQGKYRGYFSVPNVVLEGSAQTIAVGTSGKWANARLTGCAYAHFVFRTTGLSKKAESPFSSGIPGRITIYGRGSPLYDSRRDSTVPGGSGPMRANDEKTWRYVTDDGAEIGENLALLILRVLLGGRINGKLATGCGLPPKRINLMSFQVAANQCDELVNRSAGGTEPRYRGAGVLSEADDPRGALDALCAACNGRLRDVGGRLSLVIMHNDLALAAVDEGLNADDVMGPFTWNPDPSMEATPNVVRGKFTDASPNSLYQLLPYPDVVIPNNTGIENAMSFDLALVESPSQAQRIAKQALQRRQYDRTFTAPFDIRAWKYPVGTPVAFTFPLLGFDRQIFRVAEQEIGPGGLCTMTLSFETDEIYQWDADDRAPVQPAKAITYDPTRSAVFQAIDEARSLAESGINANAATQIVRASVQFPVTGSTDTTITVQAFNAALSDGTTSYDFPAATLTGLTAATSYLVIYDRSAGSYAAYPEPAVGPEVVDPDNVIVRSFRTTNADGTLPPSDPPPAGDGGGGYGGGGRYQPNVVQP
jgi:hypothetical protein